MRKYLQKQIVLVPFPFSDLSSSKVRPALVISNNDYNERNDDLILVPITSVINNDKYSLLIDNSNLIEGFLKIESRIKLNKLLTLDKSKILKSIATLDDEIFSNLLNKIYSLF